MRKLLCGSFLAVMGLAQPAIGGTVLQGNIPVLQDELQKKDFKQDILKNVDLLMFVHGYTNVMLLGGGELKLNPQMSNQDFAKRIGELEAVAESRHSIYLYDLISGLYVAKLNAVDPQGIFDANNPYAQKHIEYAQKCFNTDPKSCDVAAYIGKYYMTTKQTELSQQWLEKSSATGNGYGTYLLGTTYAYGNDGFPTNKEKAIKLYDLAMKQNSLNKKDHLNDVIVAEKSKLLSQS